MIKDKARIIISVIIYLIMTITIIVGVYFSFEVKNRKLRTSETYGNLSYVDPYADFNLFDMNLDNIEFYSDGELRYFNTSFPVKNVEFDAENNHYNLLVNNSPANAEQSSYGFLVADYDLYFQNLNGEIVSSVTMNFVVKVYVSKIDLEVKVNANNEDFGYLLEYIKINGLKLRIIEEQYRKESTIDRYIPILATSITIDELTPYSAYEDYSYNKPGLIEVKYNNIILTEGVDYVVQCGENSKNYLEEDVTIKGIGKYTGSVTKICSIPNPYHDYRTAFTESHDVITNFGGIIGALNGGNTNDALNYLPGSSNLQLTTTNKRIKMTFDKRIHTYSKERENVLYYILDTSQEFRVNIEFSLPKKGTQTVDMNGYWFGDDYTHALVGMDICFDIKILEDNDGIYAKIKFEFSAEGLMALMRGQNYFKINFFHQNNPRVKINFSSSNAYFSGGGNVDNQGNADLQNEEVVFNLNSEQTYYEEFVWNMVGTPDLSQVENEILINYQEQEFTITQNLKNKVILELDNTLVYLDFYAINQTLSLQVNTDNLEILDDLTITINNLSFTPQNPDEVCLLFLVYLPILEDYIIYDNQILNSNNSFVMPDDPELPGQTFLGWSIDGENVVNFNNISINQNTKFYALFEEN